MSSRSMLDVMCVGAANFDTIAVVQQLPKADERVTTEHIMDAAGGPAATAAVALAREGLQVGFCGVVGNDTTGRKVQDLLESEGVDTTWLRIDDDLITPRTIVLVESESATRVLIAQDYRRPRARDIPIGIAPWLHLDQIGYEPAIRAIERCDSSVRVSLDAGISIDDLSLKNIDMYVPTVASLLARYPDHTVEEALISSTMEGVTFAAATDGANGVWVLVAGRAQHVPAFSVPIVSTLGAGDVFHGAILASVLRGYEPLDAARRASAVAALSCRALDGRSGIPMAVETDEFLAAHEIGR